ncbi:GmrSD restriction endonuclease domain-containing protein [Amycolatopsis rifamycinica]|uniref:GmrSD restriction endonuclease domain-containing protein n=1 Tax=Amycolatopsis rifamycinica TaxID=287986 RepID=UPI001362963D|nr:DUF262 domain-containing protein [Amycolatopsis rifamycinica]
MSIIARYPAGTLLFWEQDDNQIRARPFEGYEVEIKKNPVLVLDGQQRLTAIIQALAGQGSHLFYADLKKLEIAHREGSEELDASRLDDVIVYREVKARSKAKRPPAGRREEAEQNLFPLSLVGGDDTEDWVDEIETLDIYEDNKAERKRVQKLIKDYLRPIREYRFPVVELPGSTPLDAVCRIFETLNRTGIKLTVFELLTARFWPAGIDLRGAWEDAKKKHPILVEYKIDPYSLLQAVTLNSTRAKWRKTSVKSRPTASAQRSDVLELGPAEFNEYWPQVVSGAAKALTMLRTDCGVLSPKWLPYSMLVVPLAAAWHLVDQKKGANVAAAKAKLRRFFWCSVFMRNYDQGSNSQAGRDFVDIEGWLSGEGVLPEAVSDFVVPSDTLDTAKVNLQALYKGVIALTLSTGARDFHTGSQIVSESLQKESIDAHHVFPKAFLQEFGPRDAPAELILNRALIDSTTNQRLGRTGPSKYFEVIEESLGQEQLTTILDSQLLPSDENSGLFVNDYQKFLDERKEIVIEEIKRVTSS